MVERARCLAVGLSLQVLLGCAARGLDCETKNAVSVTRLPDVYPEACREWPYPPALRAQLTERAFELLEAIYAGGSPGGAASLLHARGVSVQQRTQAESGPLEFRLLPPDRYHELFDGELARWLTAGMYGLRGRAVDVGARWNIGRNQLCVAHTERAEGMFEGAVYVHLFRTAAETQAGLPNGVVLIFEPDTTGEWRVTALLSTEQGV